MDKKGNIFMIIIKANNKETYIRSLEGKRGIGLTKKWEVAKNFKSEWVAKEFIKKYQARMKQEGITTVEVINTNKREINHVIYRDSNLNLLRDGDMLVNIENGFTTMFKQLDNTMCIQKQNGCWYPILDEHIITRSGDYGLESNAIKLLDYIKM